MWVDVDRKKSLREAGVDFMLEANPMTLQDRLAEVTPIYKHSL